MTWIYSWTGWKSIASKAVFRDTFLTTSSIQTAFCKYTCHATQLIACGMHRRVQRQYTH